MNRLKAYFKWLYEKGMLEDVKISEFPINKTVSTNPSYLTKSELKFIFRELDKLLLHNHYLLKKRDYEYASYQLRAMLHMLYATGLRNAELRKLKHTDINISNMTGIVIGKGAKQNNFTFNSQAKKALTDYLAVKVKYYGKSENHMQYLFTSANFGTPITATGLNIAMKNF
jgi:site-specific recombinase XerD